MKFYDLLNSSKVGETFVKSCGIGVLEITKISDFKCLIRVCFCLSGFEQSLDSIVSTTNICTIMEAACILNEFSYPHED